MRRDDNLAVYRDKYGSYQKVGSLSFPTGDPDEPTFSYEKAYLQSAHAAPISLSLPLQANPCDTQVTYAFFEGLLAEGHPRQVLAASIHAEEDSFFDLLARFDYESAGNLVFSIDGHPPEVEKMGYRRVDGRFFERFADMPTASMVRNTRRTRVSIAGAMNKLGLYKDKATGTWYQPEGGAPTTHVIKAPDEAFRYQVENEALCLKAARGCGLPAVDCEMITTSAGNLLAVKRFDRAIPRDALLAQGLPIPFRSHQEDFCQAIGRPGFMKYEEQKSDYLSEMAGLIRSSCANPLRDVDRLLDYLVFDYLVGNCDNHLKNYSLLYGEDSAAPSLAPMYDVLHCTCYEVDTIMGVPLSASRDVYGLGKEGLVEHCKRIPYSSKRVLGKFRDMSSNLPRALEEAERELLDSGMAREASFRESVLRHAERVMAGLER